MATRKQAALDWLNAGSLAADADDNVVQLYSVYHDAYLAAKGKKVKVGDREQDAQQYLRHQFRVGYVARRGGCSIEMATEIVDAGKAKGEPRENVNLCNAAMTAFTRFVVDTPEVRAAKRGSGAGKPKSPFVAFVMALPKKAAGLNKTKEAAFLRDLKKLCIEYGIE